MAELLTNNTISASGSYSELSQIREFVRRRASEAGLNLKKIESVVLAVDEACSNLIHYGLDFDDSKKIKVHTSIDENEFVIKIEDNCTSFDPRSNPSPNMDDYFKRFKKGGLGIHIMKSIIDKIEYLPSSPTRDSNQLKLIMSI